MAFNGQCMWFPRVSIYNDSMIRTIGPSKVIRHNYNISEEANVFIFVGRIGWKEKEISSSFWMPLRSVSADHELVTWLIVGSGPDLEGTNNGLVSVD